MLRRDEVYGRVYITMRNVEVLPKAMRAVASANDELRGVFTVDCGRRRVRIRQAAVFRVWRSAPQEGNRS